MAEPVNPRGDWLTIVGAKDPITVEPYRPATDDFGTAIDAFGFNGPSRVEMRITGDGEVRVTTATWYFAGDELTTRPPLLSKITGADSKVWVIERFNPDQTESVFAADTVQLV